MVEPDARGLKESSHLLQREVSIELTYQRDREAISAV